jgi:glycosyltransferase involved in cell wall biosynthesis
MYRAPHPVLLATGGSVESQHTSYTLLARYLPEAELITAGRKDPHGLLQRALVAALTRSTVTRWYRLGSLAAEWRVWRKFRSGVCSLVHILWGDRDFGFLDYALPTAGVPLCATFHCCPDTLPAILRHPRRLRRLDAVLLMSETQRHFFEACGLPSNRIHVIQHGVDTAFFSPPRQSEKPSFTVLSVGNYRRNFERLREVCLCLAARSEIRVKVVAPPNRKRYFASTPNVEFLSDLSDTELRKAYQDASCLLMTLDGATANNAVLEAMACGLPVVSEDVGGIVEYTRQDCAKLCPKGSVEALVRAVMELRDQPEQAAMLSASARARSVELDWCKVAKRTFSLYEQLLKRHDSGQECR